MRGGGLTKSFFALAAFHVSFALDAWALPSSKDLQGNQQPEATGPPAIARPHRALEWGDINVLHTTDTHGWLLGHLKSEDPEPNYSGDWGDYYSFVQAMNETAKYEGVDLLVVDSGDLHDGNGLADAEVLAKPGSIAATTALEIFAEIPYDILAIGNHELYNFTIAKQMHEVFAPRWQGRYLTSNVFITISGDLVPIGSLFRKFETSQRRRITAFGVLFAFRDAASGIVVQSASEMVQQQWFQDAIREAPDAFVVAGHMPADDPDWDIVHNAIRGFHPQVPILAFGGHRHIRDCRMLSPYSMALASGRYFETIGWMSVHGLKSLSPPRFSRRYLDQNRNTYTFHAGRDFDTVVGHTISSRLRRVASEFGINEVLGVAPRSYYGSRVPIDDKSSLVNLLVGSNGLLETLVPDPYRPHPAVIAINTGGIRADIFQGNFTISDVFITFPFRNAFLYVEGVKKEIAANLEKVLNEGGAKLRATGDGVGIKLPERLHPASHTISSGSQHPLIPDSTANLTYGYVTKDACGPDGDDVAHRPLQRTSKKIPDYGVTKVPKDAEVVDVVFLDFIRDFVIDALNEAEAPGGRRYNATEVKLYSDVVLSDYVKEYARRSWQT